MQHGSYPHDEHVGVPSGRYRARHRRQVAIITQSLLIAVGAFAVQAFVAGPTSISAITSATMFDTSGAGISLKSSSDMATGRFQHVSVPLRDGRVLVTGGEVDGGIPTASAEIYDPSSASWASTGSMGTARRAHIAITLKSGDVLVAGGLGRSAVGRTIELASAEVYDPTSGSWHRVADMHSPRALATATLLNDGRVVVIGGAANASSSVGSEVYDAVGNIWTSIADTAPARIGHATALLADGRLLTIGGTDGAKPGYLASSRILDPTTMTWMPGPDLSVPRSQHTAAKLIDGRIIVFGGLTGTGQTTNATEVLDAESTRWHAGPPMNFGRVLHAAVGLPDGRQLVAGGLHDGTLIGQSEVLNASGTSWAAVSQPAIDTMAASAVAIGSGQFMISGGTTGSVAGSSSTAYAGTNDYPSNLAAAPRLTVIDPWNFWNKECTSFAAFRVNRDGHAMSNNMNGGHFGDAFNWASNARAIGIPLANAPTLAAVAQSYSVGHVAYEEVPAANEVEDYNYYLTGDYLDHPWTATDMVWIVFGAMTGPSGVALASWGNVPQDPNYPSGRLDLFALDASGGGLIHSSWPNEWSGTWDNEQGTGNPAYGAPSAVSWGYNRIDIVALDANRRAIHAYWGDGGWHTWDNSMGTPSQFDAGTTLAASSWGSLHLDVFAIGGQGLWWKNWDGCCGWSTGGVNGWTSIGKPPSSLGVWGSAGATSRGYGAFDVFVWDTGLQLWDWRYANGSGNWSLVPLGGLPTSPFNVGSSPAVSSMYLNSGVNEMDVFVTINGTVYQSHWAGGWGGFNPLPGLSSAGDIQAASWQNGRIDILARRASDGEVFHNGSSNSGVAWNGWDDRMHKGY